MSEDEFMEISRRINSRICSHTHCMGSVNTCLVNKAKADECIQILKIIEQVLVGGMNKNDK